MADGKRLPALMLPTEDGAEDDVDNFDDEYALAGVEDPKILLTTSRDPSSKLAQFAKVGPAATTNLPKPHCWAHSYFLVACRKCACVFPMPPASTAATQS